MKFSTSDNLDIYYKVVGDLNNNTPNIIVMPGGPGANHEQYIKHTDLIGDMATLIYFDPRGCGESDCCDPSLYELNRNITDIDELRQHLKLDTIDIIGTSYGAMTAIAYAIKYPNHARKMLTVGGAGSYHFLERAKNNLVEHGTTEQKSVCEKWLWPGQFKTQADIQTYFDVMATLYSVKARTDTDSVAYDKSTFAIDPINVSFGSDFWHFDLLDQFSKITADCHYLVGDQDWINDPITVKQMADLTPNAQYTIIKNCGHAVSTDATEQYQKILHDCFRHM